MVALDDQLARLETLSPAELRAQWRAVYKNPAPDIGPDLLRRGIAYRVQEKAQGRLSGSMRRELVRLAGRLEKDGGLATQPTHLKPGTRLVRTWHDRTIQVLVCDEGFEFDGRRYDSLSQIAKDITGAHWSGPRFFGLVRRRSPPRANA